MSEAMDDLEERLLDYADAGSEIAGCEDDMRTAADRLRRYREALVKIARDRDGYMGEYHAECQQTAREALQLGEQ